MAGRFLTAAYQVLKSLGKPLTASQLTQAAIDISCLNTSGATPAHTMRARLSDDIRTKAHNSVFQRVGPNRFGLRDWGFPEYYSRPFTKALPAEVTVCLPGTLAEMIADGGSGFFLDPRPMLSFLRERSNLILLDRRIAETTSRYKQLIAYVWLETEDNKVLCYTRGKYSSAHGTLLLGRRSVGFGGHVLQQDADNLFGLSDAGLEQAALREIGEEIGRALPDCLVPIGVIWDDTSYEGQKHVAVAMRGRLPHSGLLKLKSAERSINQLRLFSRSELWQSFHTMEFWSQILIRQLAGNARPDNISKIVPGKRPPFVEAIALVGEIASGKTFIARAFAENLGFHVISVSAILRKILGVAHSGEEERLAFQNLALDFIESFGGPGRLAEHIVAAINETKVTRVVIDGVRQLETLESLRKQLPNLLVIFVDCPRDTAYRNYCYRQPDASVLQFAAVREHRVEAELPRLRYEADAVVNNADTPEKTFEVLACWLTSDSQ